MISFNRWKIWVVIVLGLVTFIPVVQAEQPFDFTYCGSSTLTMVSASKELTVGTFDMKGITISNLENKVFDNMTFHCVAVFQVMDGKSSGKGYCKDMDPDGDFFIIEFTLVGMDATTRFLQGTGKWKGITGEGKSVPITRGKPITPGTSQDCRRATGTFELPK
jgi:hypothetical protein